MRLSFRLGARWLSVVAVACASRSSLPTPPSGSWPTSVQGLPVAPTSCTRAAAVHACSTLRVATPKQPFDIDDAFVTYPAGSFTTPMLVRNGGVELVKETSGTFASGISLLHLTLASNPPLLSAQSSHDMRFDSDTMGVVAYATDGTAFYTIDQYDPHHVTGRISSWSASNEVERSNDLVDLGGPAVLEATNGLVFGLFGFYGPSSPRSEMLVADASSGAVLWDRLVDGTTYSAASYACGFAYALVHDAFSATTITMLPLDGQAESTVAIDADSNPVVYPWPYDPRTVAVLWRRPTFMPEPDGGCAIHLALVRDDGNVTTQTFPHACNFPIASECDTVAALAVGSFGAVLHDGAGNFQLLDATGAALGDPISISLAPYRSDVVVGGVGDYVVVLTAEGTDQLQVSQMVIACGP